MAMQKSCIWNVISDPSYKTAPSIIQNCLIHFKKMCNLLFRLSPSITDHLNVPSLCWLIWYLFHMFRCLLYGLTAMNSVCKESALKSDFVRQGRITVVCFLVFDWCGRFFISKTWNPMLFLFFFFFCSLAPDNLFHVHTNLPTRAEMMVTKTRSDHCKRAVVTAIQYIAAVNPVVLIPLWRQQLSLLPSKWKFHCWLHW